MPQLRHVAITTHDVEKTAKFYIDVFGMKEMGKINDPGTTGCFLSDGVMNLAILHFKNDQAAGVERGAGFKGIHHIGFEVEDMATIQEKLAAAGSTRRHDVEQALGVMPGERKHMIFKLTPYNPLDDMAEVVVPAGHLFVMGDNRDNSADSRVPVREGGVGLLPVNDLVGRVDGIVGSWDLGIKSKPVWTWPQGLRLARFFSAVN